VTIIFGGFNVLMRITFIQIPNFLSQTQKTTKTKNKSKNVVRKTNHKCKPKSNPKLEIQICKAKTRYMLKSDSNKNLFTKNYKPRN
jgi:hypothetical protein